MPVRAPDGHYVYAYDDGDPQSAPVERYYVPGSSTVVEPPPPPPPSSNLIADLFGAKVPIGKVLRWAFGSPFTSGSLAPSPYPAAISLAFKDNLDGSATLSWDFPGTTHTAVEASRDGFSTDPLEPEGYKATLSATTKSIRFTKMKDNTKYTGTVVLIYDTNRSVAATATVMMGSGGTAASTTVVLTPIEDVFTLEGQGNQELTYLKVDSNARTWLKFDLSSIAGTLSAAKLTMTTVTNATSLANQTVHLSTNDTWTETGLTAANAPAFDAVAIGDLLGEKVGATPYSTNLDVATIQSQFGGMLSLVLAQTSTDGIDYRQRTGSTPPALELTYTPSDTFVLRTTKPTEGNTGVPAGTTLETIEGDVTVPAGGRIEGKRINGRLIMGANSTAVLCEVLGPLTVAATGEINLVNATAGGVVLDRCTVDPRAVNESTNGVRATKVRLIRTKIINCVDPISLVGADDGSSWEGCFFGKFAYLTPCSYQSDNQTHNDCVQFHNSTGNTGGLNAIAVGNTYSAKYGAKGTHQPSHRGINATGTAMPSGASNPAAATMMFSPFDVTKVLNFRSEDDWFDGGFIAVNTGGSKSSDLGTFVRAKFDGDHGLTTAGSTDHPLTFVKSGAIFTTPDATYYAGPFIGQAVKVR